MYIYTVGRNTISSRVPKAGMREDLYPSTYIIKTHTGIIKKYIKYGVQLSRINHGFFYQKKE